MSKLRIALVQMSCGPQVQPNLDKAAAQIAIAAAKGAKIVCLQELFATRYFPQTKSRKYFALAQSDNGPLARSISAAARKAGCVVIAPFFEKAAKGVYYNSAAVFDADGKLAGKYRKMHIPDDAGFYEKFYFTPGDLGFKPVKTRFATIGVMICYDQWFPEPARLLALRGAEILFYPTAIGWKPSRPQETKQYHDAWETIQRSHAIANGVYVAAVNRVGVEGRLKFWGGSFVAGPFGEVVYRASANREEIVVEDCDLALIEKTRGEWPFFRDRRADAYVK